MMSEQPKFGTPEWQQAAQEAMGRAGRAINDALGQTRHILMAQTAMGWAYRGDLDKTRRSLAGMSPERLRELSAAATMLAALTDEEMSSR